MSRRMTVGRPWLCMVGSLLVASLASGAESDAAGKAAPTKIGDEVCVLRSLVVVDVTDVRGEPVGDAEVWLLDDWRERMEPFTTAARIGRTGPTGRVSASVCMMMSGSFPRWRPKDSVEFSFLVVKEGFLAGWCRKEVETDAFLAKANVLGVPVGHEIDWSSLQPRTGAYVMNLALQLRRGVCADTSQ